MVQPFASRYGRVDGGVRHVGSGPCASSITGVPVVCTCTVTRNIVPEAEPVQTFVSMFSVPFTGIATTGWVPFACNVVPEEYESDHSFRTSGDRSLRSNTRCGAAGDAHAHTPAHSKIVALNFIQGALIAARRRQWSGQCRCSLRDRSG